MCGHFGYATMATTGLAVLRSAFVDGLYVDGIRGFDSTGVAAVPARAMDKPPIIYKRALPVYDYMNTRVFTKMMQNVVDFSVLIGHNRAATRGKVVDDAAHPYTHGPITLAHNGTLDYTTNLDGNFETDSEEIPYTMSREGEHATLERINGAFALVWYNHEKQTINFARNKDRPLCYTISDCGDHIFWASEVGLLEWILERNNIKHGNIWLPQPRWWVHFDVGSIDNFSKQDSSKTIKNTTSFTEYVPKKTVYPTYPTVGAGWSKGVASEAAKKLGVEVGDLIAFELSPQNVFESKAAVAPGQAPRFNIFAPTKLLMREGGAAFNPEIRLYSVPEDTVTDWLSNIDDKTKTVVLYSPIKSVSYMNYAEKGSNQGRNLAFYVDLAETWVACTGSEYGIGPYSWCRAALSFPDAKGPDYPGFFEDDEEDDEDGLIPEAGNEAMFLGPRGKFIKEKEMEVLIKDGCNGCGLKLTPEDYENGVFDWIQHKPVCFNCSDLSHKEIIPHVGG